MDVCTDRHLMPKPLSFGGGGGGITLAKSHGTSTHANLNDIVSVSLSHGLTNLSKFSSIRSSHIWVCTVCLGQYFPDNSCYRF